MFSAHVCSQCHQEQSDGHTPDCRFVVSKYHKLVKQEREAKLLIHRLEKEKHKLLKIKKSQCIYTELQESPIDYD